MTGRRRLRLVPPGAVEAFEVRAALYFDAETGDSYVALDVSDPTGQRANMHGRRPRARSVRRGRGGLVRGHRSRNGAIWRACGVGVGGTTAMELQGCQNGREGIGR